MSLHNTKNTQQAKNNSRIIDKKTQLKKSDPSLDHKAIMLATLCEINWIRSNLILMEIICILATSFRFVRSLGIHRTSTSWEESFTLTDLWKLTYFFAYTFKELFSFSPCQNIVFTLLKEKHMSLAQICNVKSQLFFCFFSFFCFSFLFCFVLCFTFYWLDLLVKYR